MAELGSVFEDPGEGPRGPDLRVSVEVPRAALGASLRAPVPRRIAAEGELVERATIPGQDPDSVELHLPEELPARTMLRLRGQGGRPPAPGDDDEDGAAGQAGDLMVVVELVDRPPRDDEIITRSPTALARSEDSPLATSEGRDITWWLLLALALIGGGVVALFAL